MSSITFNLGEAAPFNDIIFNFNSDCSISTDMYSAGISTDTGAASQVYLYDTLALAETAYPLAEQLFCTFTPSANPAALSTVNCAAGNQHVLQVDPVTENLFIGVTLATGYEPVTLLTAPVYCLGPGN